MIFICYRKILMFDIAFFHPLAQKGFVFLKKFENQRKIGLIEVNENSQNEEFVENNSSFLIKNKKSNNCKPKLFARKPLIYTNPDKYLIALSHNGPTNQLMGLRDSIFLSIRLNRTLILPRFYKVVTDSREGDKEVPADSRFDISTLSKLLSFHYNNEVKKLCGNAVELLTTGRECDFLKRRYSLVEKTWKPLGIPFPKNKDGTPRVLCSNKGNDFKHILNSNSDRYKCIAFAFYGLGISASTSGARNSRVILQKLESKKIEINVSNMSHDSVYSLGFVSTGLPSLVKELATRFAKQFFGSTEWLAVHWRYDPKDWMSHCKSEEPVELGAYKAICTKLKTVEPKDILSAGITFLQAQSSEIINNVKAIYLATPLAQKAVIQGVEREYRRLKNRNKIDLKVLTSTALKTFVQQNKDCIIDQSTLNDTLALVEMQICIKSTVFLYSERSSWSGNVMKERMGKPYADKDRDILSAAWKQHTKN